MSRILRPSPTAYSADASPHHEYRPEIDGLRALAVLMVVAYHFDESLVGGGFLGVDLFFVISGYVVSASLATRLHLGARKGLLRFYTRRVKRLLPALLVCAIVTGIATTLVCHHPRQGLLTGASSMFGLSGLALWVKDKDYFAFGQQLNTFTHTWSLGIEEQFYLVFPWLMFAPLTLRRHFRSTLAALVLLSLGGFLWMSSVDASAAFYFMPFRMWELCIGALVWASARKHTRQSTQSASAGRILAAQFTVLLTAFAVPFAAFEDSTTQTIVAVVLFALTLHLANTPGPMRAILSARPAIYIGKISYSLYLWHWLVLSISLNAFGVKRPLMILLPLAAILAISSYHLIESPLRRARWFSGEENGSWKVIGVGFACAAGCATFLLMLVRVQPFIFLGDPRYLGHRSFLLDNPCHLLKEEDGAEKCLLTRGSGPALYLLGDSHGGNLLIGARLAAEQLGFRFAYLTNRTYESSQLEVPNCGTSACPEDEIGRHLDLLAQVLKPGDVIFFSLSRDRLFGDMTDHPHRVPDPVLFAALRLRLHRLAEGTTALGARLVFIEDIPKVCSELKYATAAFLDDACRVSRNESIIDREPLSRLYHDVAAGFENVEIIDPHDIYCEDGVCSNFLGEEIIYVDASPHLTKEASAKAATLLGCSLSRGRSESAENCRDIISFERINPRSKPTSNDSSHVH